METIVKLGAWGCAGLLAGIAAITWLGDELDSEGAAFMVLMFIALFVIAGGIFGFFFGRKDGG